jgi:site-specific recombinase XerD
MATLIKNKTGIYYIVYYDKGKRLWRSLGTKDRNVAYTSFLEYERKGILQKDIPEPIIKPTKLTLKQAISEYLSYVKVNFSNHTYIDYKSITDMFIKVIGPDKSIEDVTIRDIERYKHEKQCSKKISPHTINHDLRCIKAFFNLLVTWELLDKSPGKAVKLIRTDDTTRPYFSKEELRALLESTQGSKLHSIILFAVLTGLRLGEIVNLPWEDVLLDKRKIIIRSNGNFRTKTGKIRTLPISSALMKLLSDMPNKSGLVFKHVSEKALRTEYVSKLFKKAVRACGLDEALHFHSLRHTFGSYLVEQGVSLFHVQQLLGHSSPWVTQIYAHLGTNELMSSVEKIDIKVLL